MATTPGFLPEKFHGQRSLAGYSPWGSQRVGHSWATEYTQNIVQTTCCLSIHLLIHGIYLLFGYCEKCCYDHGCTSISLRSCFLLEYISSSGIAGSCGNSVLNFLRNCQSIFHRGWIILRSHHQGKRVPVCPHAGPTCFQGLEGFIFFLNSSHPSGFEN